MEKKAAMEMSVGTLVTIVLLMAVLGLGLFLVNKIFGGATESVDTINDKVLGEINDLFSDQDASVVVKLGADRKAKIKDGTDDFGIAIGAQTSDGSSVGTRSRLQYKLELDTSETGNCIAVLGGSAQVKSLMAQRTSEWIGFDGFDGSTAWARLSFNIPKGTAECSQKIFVDVKDTARPQNSTSGTYLKIQII